MSNCAIIDNYPNINKRINKAFRTPRATIVFLHLLQSPSSSLFFLFQTAQNQKLGLAVKPETPPTPGRDSLGHSLGTSNAEPNRTLGAAPGRDCITGCGPGRKNAPSNTRSCGPGPKCGPARSVKYALRASLKDSGPSPLRVIIPLDLSLRSQLL